MKKVKVKLEVQYDGHSVKKNTSVDLRFKAPYSELVNCLELLQLLNCNVEVLAKINTNKPIKIGTFYLNELKVDRDGESNIKFNSESDFVELNNINLLSEKEIVVNILCVGNIEEDEEGDE